MIIAGDFDSIRTDLQGGDAVIFKAYRNRGAL